MMKGSKFNVFVRSNNQAYVINTLTGSVIELEPAEFEFINQQHYSQLPNSVVEALSAEGVLIDKNLDEMSMLKNSYFHCKSDNSIFRLVICPTLDCNFACPYCYETRKKGAMTEKVQDDLISFIRQKLKNDVSTLAITWYGGEPLLYPDIILNLSNRIKKLCAEYEVEFYQKVITNGYLLNNEMNRILERIGVSSIQITIDGNEQQHNARRYLRSGGDTFAQVVENVRALEATTISVNIRVNMDRTNADAFAEVKDIFQSLKNVHCYPALVTIEDTQSEFQQQACYAHADYEEFYSHMGPSEMLSTDEDGVLGTGIYHCIAEDDCSFVVDPTGLLYKCLNDICNTHCAVASVCDQTFHNADIIQKYYDRDPFAEQECCDCAYIPFCYGGCTWNFINRGVHVCLPQKYLLRDAMLKKHFNFLKNERIEHLSLE